MYVASTWNLISIVFPHKTLSSTPPATACGPHRTARIMSSSLPTAVAETIQTAHIKHAPSPQHDLAPGTAADKKEPIHLEPVIDDEDDDVPFSVVRPRRRRPGQFPPLPDLRFEQSYLHSIAGAEGWGRIAWITLRDQVRSGSFLHRRRRED
jgi:hypothetical protein